MKLMKVYLDNAATTKVDEQVAKTVQQYSTKEFGNPGSIHTLGQNAKNALETARASIAKKINAEPSEIIFTSGGTESNNMAIKGIAYSVMQSTGKKGRIITSRFEHLAVLNCCKQLEKEGFKVSYVGVDKDGFVKIDDLKKAIQPDTILVTNNARQQRDRHDTKYCGNWKNLRCKKHTLSSGCCAVICKSAN